MMSALLLLASMAASPPESIAPGCYKEILSSRPPASMGPFYTGATCLGEERGTFAPDRLSFVVTRGAHAGHRYMAHALTAFPL